MTKKLLGSKWTSLEPTNKEKHFVVTHVDYRKNGDVAKCLMQSVMTGRLLSVDPPELSAENHWQQGWC